ncbi:MAG: SGNH/GDSL hydrolase family protein [Hamadaea sp.]|nr:SGNH/GDSL hydrolase family protein [Hamadaea sp.]NUT08671.1 SGNH/GDSL hydrolase family protein [Hamadaea sp.]
MTYYTDSLDAATKAAQDAARSAKAARDLVGAPADVAIAAAVGGLATQTRAALGLATVTKSDPTLLAGWFAGGIRGKKLVLVGDSTTEYAYGFNRALANYTRPGQPLDGVGILNYGWNGQTLVAWDSATSRYGKAGTIATAADLFVFSYGINDIRLGAMSEDTLTAKVIQAVTDLRAGVPGCTVLLRTPPSFTTSDTGGFAQISPQTPAAAQAYSDLMRNAYRRAAAATDCPLLDTQALVYGTKSVADTKTPLMLNQIHPNDAGNVLVARELVRMIGAPASSEPVLFSLRGRAGNVVLGRRVLSAGGRFAVGSVRYRPTAAAGTLTIEVRKVAVGGGLTVLGTVSYTGGVSTTNVITPAAALTDWNTLAAGEGVEVAITASTAPVNDIEVPVYVDEQPPVRAYPLELRCDGLVSPSGTVIYPATSPIAAGYQRALRSLTSVRLQAAGFTLMPPADSADISRTGWLKLGLSVTGTAGSQTVTATAANAAATHTIATVAGQQYTFGWKANPAGWASPKTTIVDPDSGAFIVADNTAWPAADGAGWYKVTFTATGARTNVYPIRAMASGSSIVFNDSRVVLGTDINAAPLLSLEVPGASAGDYNDASRAGWQKAVVTVTGNPGAQTVTATAASGAILHAIATTPGQQYTFAWKANAAGWATPKFTIYDPVNASFIVADNTAWPAVDGAGWYKVTFTATSATTNCYMTRGMTSGSSIVFNLAKAVAGTDITAAPLPEFAVPASVFTDDLTLLHLIRVDATTTGQPADIVDGPALIQATTGSLIGAPAATTRGTAPLGQAGSWQAVGIRQTKATNTAVVTVNDQGPSSPAASVAGSSITWNPSNQTWAGEVITFFWPYLLTDGELTAYTKSVLRTLAAAGEAITVDWPSQRYL